MKKSFILTILMSLVLFCSCNGCKEKKSEVKDLVIEEVTKVDIDSMKAKNKSDFVWLETMVLLNNYLDEENDGSFQEFVNVFQAIDSTENSKVFKFQHFNNGISIQDSIDGFWVEDLPIVDSLLKVSYDSAYTLVMNINYPKPHSKNVVLRNPLGPQKCNPQWIFGNIHEQLWVDATTGEIKTSNPAFPDTFEYWKK